jgi:hypothetical protein
VERAAEGRSIQIMTLIMTTDKENLINTLGLVRPTDLLPVTKTGGKESLIKQNNAAEY